jgi:hypothetical protein
MNGMIQYKGIFVAKGSELFNALETLKKAKPESQDAKDAQLNVKRVFSGTEDRFNKRYSKEDRDWFFSKHNKFLFN